MAKEHPQLNVTNGELLRIRNKCEGQDGEVKVWAFMLQALIDYIREIRPAYAESLAEIAQLRGAIDKHPDPADFANAEAFRDAANVWWDKLALPLIGEDRP